MGRVYRNSARWIDGLDVVARLGDHAGVRASSLLLTCSLLACAEPAEPRSKSDESTPTVAEAPVVAQPESAPQPVIPTAPIDEIDLPPAESTPEPEPVEPEPAEPEPVEPKSADPLAPIMPSGPEPGSPEADAELAELLEESTLTQAEFDAAFRNNKPKIAGDQFVFGPGERTRKQPIITLGTPKIEGSNLAASEITKLAKAHLRGFEGCLAVALVDNPELSSSVTLRARFDQKGEVSNAKIEGGAAGASLRECLAEVANNWSLAGAAGASVELLLSLRSE